MNENPQDALTSLIHEFTKLPGIGEKTATRLALHVIRSKSEDAHALSRALIDVKETMTLCAQCFHFSNGELCSICKHPRRDQTRIAVVENPNDLMAIEKTHEFNGLYHVLHGCLSPLEGIGPDELRIKELLHRIQNTAIPLEELIFALNPSVEGEATCLYLTKLIKPFGVRMTRIAHGLPMGGHLEYSDRLTIGKALENRIPC